MKLLFITLIAVIIGVVVGAQLPDSATQGPNPQDIATPEPEYIDIDGPLPEGFLSSQLVAPAPVAARSRSFNVAPQPLQRPQPSFVVPQYSQPKPAYEVPGHTFDSQSGYSYRRPPVYYRRFYRRFY